MADEKPLSQRLRPNMRVRHYKGDVYRIQSFATHAATDDAMVVYRLDSDTEWDGRIWVRSRYMFDERVENEGETKPRFVELLD